MRLSKRSEYGLRALLDLAAESGPRPISLRQLSQRNNLPMKFLEQIFLTLRASGIVLGHAGARGGYRLARPPDEVTFGEVIRLLDGRLAPVSCVSQIAFEACSCPDIDRCRLRFVMQEVRTAIIDVVDRVTLADALAASPDRS